MSDNPTPAAIAEMPTNKTLREIVDAGKLWCGDPRMQVMARELLSARQMLDSCLRLEAEISIAIARAE